MYIYVIKQIIRKVINLSFYYLKKIFKSSTKFIKILITFILILMLIRLFTY